MQANENKNEYESTGIRVYRYAFRLLPRLAELLKAELRIPVNKILAASVAIREAVERRETESKD